MSENERKIKVWDLPTRVFHWTLVTCVVIGLVTGFISPEWWMGVHTWAGYTTVVLVVFRLVWGVFGSEYSRIETFSFTPAEIFSHIRELAFLKPRHFLGHNPAGAMMIFALIFLLAGITVSGLLVLGGEENQGPLAGAANYAIGDMAAGIHALLTFILIGLVALHVIGVFVEIRLGGENLVKSMFTGFKVLPANEDTPTPRRSRPLAATVMLTAFTMIAGSVLWAFSTMPPSGLIELAENKAYTSECGDCHEVYHPSLLPKASWTKMMSELDDHFGEDASLGQKTAVNITAHLVTYAAEAWDTEASNRFRNVDAKAPYQITASAYWVRKHDEIGADVFKRKGVRIKSACGNCHKDAATGKFDDQYIDIPKK